MISQETLQYLALGAGVLSVPITSLLKNKNWDTRVKFVLSTVISFLAGLAVVIPVDASNAASVNIAATLATTLAGAQIIYKLLFEKTSLDQKLTNSFVKPKNNG